MIKIISQDIFKADIDVLVHQANCFHTMGAGIARDIAFRFPEALKADKKTKYGDPDKLGTFSYACVNNKKLGGDLIICNLYSQFGFGGGKQTNYIAFEKGLRAICNKFYDFRIGLPYGIGCGLAGGKLETVLEIIENVSVEVNSQTLYLYKI
jgi:O-acetyl-ADP-ribose deacetylase (regulator of RNase III)